MFRHFGRNAEDEIERAFRHAGVGKTFYELDAGTRGFFRRFDDDRAAGGERAGNLAHRRQRREIPRREGGHHAYRFLGDELTHILLPARHDAAIAPASFLGIPVDNVG